MSITAPDWPETERRIAEVARTRRGRHHDKALASYRRCRALELRAQGLSYEQIAQEVGYANRGTAYTVINHALQAREAESVAELRAMEVARLDALQLALWGEAMAGDLRSVSVITRIIEARCRLLGLVEPARRVKVKDERDRWDNCQGPSTVIVRRTTAGTPAITSTAGSHRLSLKSDGATAPGPDLKGGWLASQGDFGTGGTERAGRS